MLFFIRFFQLLSPYLLLNIAIEKLVKIPEKLNRNLISGIHCYFNIILTTISIFYSSNIVFSLAIFNSIGYFLYDLVYILRKGLNEYGYIVHHILSLVFLGYLLSLEIQNSFRYFILLFIGELSNIFIYPVYHLIQTDSKNQIVEKLKWWQALTYTGFRLYGFPLYVLITGLEHNILVYSLMIIYLMSFMWSYKIISKIRRN